MTYADSSLTLVLNGAEARLQIVCGHGTELVFAQEWFTPRHGMQVLVPALLDALHRMGLTLASIGRIAVVRGPGSFTGLRLVLSTALGLSLPAGLPMAGLGYMDALAADAAALRPCDNIWCITHARRGLVHMQGFTSRYNGPVCALPRASGAEFSARTEENTLVPLCPPISATLEEAAQRIITHGGDTVLTGSGVRKNSDFFAEYLIDAAVLPPRFDHPAPETLLTLAHAAAYGHEPVEPLYIRPCDAEENLDSIASAKGLDPAAARAELQRLTRS
ncbi:tRNA (adenosine(37)-N6)-threonylcarbamoyltransferase complex dimerization subunit type 1 TsaB [Desulfovibrio psychrotolerans]|uniref:tRNA (Adenosine(37)-N6)-threonylcarbamoyltransferase complex dimerization subunit type 1 TsaB n=1 Tax=Desulfovibrio psychrotolerans TaxID=415242 RepID=A0A7J0BU35_9BACT|nr:tRNA (adenosine(37)-N6)-threonylcarbamoyltransferase complex dimerization subunit type 1 TsaB [Desulfovibrio psychrotolerans]GFM37178.1 tRNA (adenosine(37)-N6)-threonylcarbamoyltransferase complex dimerization subunit type 1 TsaB [Desulfovibrio psychrotolerans]